MSRKTWTEVRLLKQAGALERWAKEPDRSRATAPARVAAFERFMREADPEGRLPSDERHARAKALQRAHMLRMSAKAVQARRLLR